MNTNDRVTPEVIGLVPAAGQATRLSPLPLSKELFPIGFHTLADDDRPRSKVIGEYLLESLQLAGINKVYIILRDGKWDIPAYFGDGSRLKIHLGYLMMGVPLGTPYTLDQAFPFVRNTRIALGFPDILFSPRDAFTRLLEHQLKSGAEIVLGLFPSDLPQKMDMVDTDAQGRVREIVIKPRQTKLRYTWVIAIWTPVFTQFMHDFLANTLTNGSSMDAPRPNSHVLPELYVGDVIRAALSAGFQVETQRFEQGRCIDIGTAEDLMKAMHDYSLDSWTD